MLELIGRRDDSDKGTIHNEGTIVLTFASPMGDLHGLWVRQPQVPTGSAEFVRMEIWREARYEYRIQAEGFLRIN